MTSRQTTKAGGTAKQDGEINSEALRRPVLDPRILLASFISACLAAAFGLGLGIYEAVTAEPSAQSECEQARSRYEASLKALRKANELHKANAQKETKAKIVNGLTSCKVSSLYLTASYSSAAQKNEAKARRAAEKNGVKASKAATTGSSGGLLPRGAARAAVAVAGLLTTGRRNRNASRQGTAHETIISHKE